MARHRPTLVANIVQELNEYHLDVISAVVVSSDRHTWSTLLLKDMHLPLDGPCKVKARSRLRVKI